MSDITVTFKNETILTMDASGTKTLQTQGKYCEDDIEVVYVRPSGGSQQVEADLISGALTGNYVNPLVTAVHPSAFSYVNVTSVSLPNCVSIRDAGFRRMPEITRIYVPKATGSSYDNYIFGNCPKLELIALPSMTRSLPLAFYDCTRLHTVDLGPNVSDITNQTFYHTALTTLIIRRESSIMGITTNVFNNSPFASGGTGCTIYIPKALYDHLGDGTALDYKAATNWSTIDGYGTITWAKIEDSQYENYYADGTPVT